MAENESKATEAAAKKAQDLGIALDEVEGTGADGNVTVDDVQKAASARDREEKKTRTVVCNPDLKHFSVGISGRTFYKNPNLHPEGPDAQNVTHEEWASLKEVEVSGVPALVEE